MRLLPNISIGRYSFFLWIKIHTDLKLGIYAQASSIFLSKEPQQKEVACDGVVIQFACLQADSATEKAAVLRDLP